MTFTDAELREHIALCCGDRVGQVFCESFGCATVLPLLDRLEQYRAALLLVAQHEAFLGHPAPAGQAPSAGDVFWYASGRVTTEGEPVIALNVSDTFHYATADAEPIAYEDCPALLTLAVTEGWPGLVRWVEARRGTPLIKPVQLQAQDYDATLASLRQERDRLALKVAQYQAQLDDRWAGVVAVTNQHVEQVRQLQADLAEARQTIQRLERPA